MKPAFISVVCLAAGIAWGQSSEASLRFEAATVKPAAPQQGQGSGWNIRRNPGRYTATNATLRALLLNAYALKDYQLQTPGWMENERYDISAVTPEAASKQQVDAMLQALLSERFKIELHREQRETPIYTLAVAKNGPKLKESTVEAEPPPATTDGAGRAGMPPMFDRSMAAPPKDKDGFPIVKRGWASSTSEGRVRMTAVGMTMAELTKMLSTQLQRDVLDKTELSGKYDFRLEYAADGTMAPPVPLPPMAAMEPSRQLADASGPPIFRALQDQLGLKLESGKAPREVLVIDKAEKMPIEN